MSTFLFGLFVGFVYSCGLVNCFPIYRYPTSRLVTSFGAPRPPLLQTFERVDDGDHNGSAENKQGSAARVKNLLSNDRTTPQRVSRRMFMATTAAIATTIMILEDEAEAAETMVVNTKVPLPWEPNPVNKRSGITVSDVEKTGYNVAFVTYLSRFLLNFDTNCQKFWFASVYIPKTATAAEVERIRLEQFAAFSASVELGLRQYNQSPGGPRELLQELVQRYGRLPEKKTDDENNASQRRIAKSARRHVALLFGLMEINQPTQEITKLLASVDNGYVSSVQLLNETLTLLQGYEMGKEPTVTFSLPQAGGGYEVAEGRAVLKPTGGLLRVDVASGGSGYSSPALVSVSSPKGGGKPARLQAKIVDGSVVSLRVIDPGSGYTDKDAVEITVVSPTTASERAEFTPVLNMLVDSIEVTKGGSGYAIEKPTKVYITPPPDKAAKVDPILVGLSYPSAEKSSFTSFRKEADTQQLRDQETDFERLYNLQVPAKPAVSGIGSASSSPGMPFWMGRSSSSAELLRLMPAGVGLEYDTITKSYAWAMDTTYMQQYPAFLQLGSNRIIGTEFGPRGRAPIERDMELVLSDYLRFCLSGATCASVVHVALTPLDVVKTKIQTSPVDYPTIGTAFRKIAEQDGLPTFFTGWLPTLLGNFAAGGVVYVTTEFIRRYLSEAAGVDALTFEVPIILIAAGIASAMGAILSCPFETVRIRTVAQPEFARNSIGVFTRMVREEGIGSLTDAIPVFLVRNMPYAMTKFTIFDLSTERLYQAFPAAQENIKLSLLVSLVGGILGGTAAG
jgi:solute carrier family 25 (mitochondrial phosphate transporter), member 3